MGEYAYNEKYSIKAYLQLEKEEGEKLEYFEGEIFAMAGGNP